MAILGAATNDGQSAPPAIAPEAGSDCIRILGDGVMLGYATAVIYDQNGALPGPGNNSVNGADLAIAKNDVGAAALGAPYRGRTDSESSTEPTWGSSRISSGDRRSVAARPRDAPASLDWPVTACSQASRTMVNATPPVLPGHVVLRIPMP
jgi:hypothetical protein